MNTRMVIQVKGIPNLDPRCVQYPKTEAGRVCTPVQEMALELLI
jgi:hypothetical protein